MSSRATVSLDFIVVGGSIAGLACAYALKKAGHDVVVMEATDGQAKSKGGLQSPPNMTKILYRWGLKPSLDRLALKVKKFTFHNGTNGKTLGTMVMDEEFMTDLLADFLFIQHQDLKDMILDLALREGISILYNTQVSDIIKTNDSISLRTASGQTLSPDVVLLADGIDSQFRHLVTEVADNNGVDSPTKHLSITFLIPVEQLKEEEELTPVLTTTEWQVWMGSEFVIHTNIIMGGTMMTGTLTYTFSRDVKSGEEVWSDRPMGYWELDFEKFHSVPRKLLKKANVVSARITYSKDLPTDFVCRQSKLVLVGDAAHPLLPGGNHRTGLIVEDAETLASLFSRIQHRDHISHFLTAYEEIRHPRCEWAYTFDRGFHAMVKCPGPGPEQDERDELLRQTMAHGDWDHMDETTFRAVWGDEVNLYAHDAAEKVDDWWSKWGSLVGRTSNIDGSTSDASAPIPGLRRVSVSLQS